MQGATWKHLALLCAALAIVLGARSLLRVEIYPEAKTIGNEVATFQQLSERFVALAKEKGGAYAFEILREAALPPNTDLHLLGHAVGDILYEQEGVDAIKECTQEFRNACSHSVVIGALNEFGAGDATIKKIQEACAFAPGGPGAYTMCFHGLGHGVFAYFGYDIPKTVAFCKRLGTPAHGEQEYPQCVGGMTMELVGGGGHDRDTWVSSRQKYLDPADPLSPCDRSLVPDEAKSFCYTYLTPRLFEAAGADLANPDPSTFPEAFSYCDVIKDVKLREGCYGSFGKEFIPLAAARDIRNVDAMSDEQYRLAISWCSTAKVAAAKDACIAQELESVFWGGENDPQASLRFCSLVSGERMQATCYRTLAYDVSLYVPDSGQHAALCASLPEAYREECAKTRTAGI
jgi:hypothetical protein